MPYDTPPKKSLYEMPVEQINAQTEFRRPLKPAYQPTGVWDALSNGQWPSLPQWQTAFGADIHKKTPGVNINRNSNQKMMEDLARGAREAGTLLPRK